MLMLHLSKIFKYFLFPLFVFIFDLVAWLYLGIYDIFPWFDIPMHLIGGFAIGFTFFFSLKYFDKEGIIKLNPLFHALFVISLVTLIAVLWEFVWFALEFFIPAIPEAILEDTLLDLALGIIGGMLSVIVLEIRKF